MRTAVCTLLGGRFGGRSTCIAPSPRACGEDGGARLPVPVRGLPQVQLKVVAIPMKTSRIKAVREAAAGGRAGGRRQHRLAPAPGGARGPRGGGRRRLHRAALPLVRGMPGRAPAHQPSLRARRDDRRRRRAAARARRESDGRRQPQDREGGRPHEGAADPRPLRVPRHRYDHRAGAATSPPPPSRTWRTRHPRPCASRPPTSTAT